MPIAVDRLQAGRLPAHGASPRPPTTGTRPSCWSSPSPRLPRPCVWIMNVIAGPAAGASGALPTSPALRVPEQDLPEPTVPDWYPQFVDHFALPSPVGTTVRPPEVSVIRHRANLPMILESAIWLTRVALVVARAVSAPRPHALPVAGTHGTERACDRRIDPRGRARDRRDQRGIESRGVRLANLHSMAPCSPTRAPWSRWRGSRSTARHGGGRVQR